LSPLDKLKMKNKELREEVVWHQSKSRKNRKDKNSLKTLHQVSIVKKRAMYNLAKGSYAKKLIKAEMEGNKYKEALVKIFSPKQIQLLVKGQHHVKWDNEDIGRAITLRYKSNSYEHLRALHYPFPSTRTIQRWTASIPFAEGILWAAVDLLKNYFQDATDFERQGVLVFDEMSLESAYAYDAGEDRVYGPKSEMNVYFFRCLFQKVKQPISFRFDDDFSKEKLQRLVEVLQEAGMRIRCIVSDLGGKNRSVMNKFDVKVRKVKKNGNVHYDIKSSFKNPNFPYDDIWWFPDAPHLIKLLRNALMKWGLMIEDGNWITKADMERMLDSDIGELKANFKLTHRHFNLKGREKMRVLPAVQVFSNTTAAVWRKVFQNRPKQGDFIELFNNWFDLMNTRSTQDAHNPNPFKTPFGTHLNLHMELLHKVEKAVLDLRVGDKPYIYPFQRGMLQSINSTKGLFNDLSGSSMRVSSLLMHRVNQDCAENAFCRIRQFGGNHSSPSAVDAKRRLKLLCLSWGGTTFKTAPVAEEDSQPFLTAQMISSLRERIPKGPLPEIPPLFIDPHEVEANLLSEENLEEEMASMGIVESCEFAGKEYVAGYVAFKLYKTHPQLRASVEELERFGRISWVKSLRKNNLVVPSVQWLNFVSILEEEFQNLHRRGDKNKIYLKTGVLKGFCKSLSIKYNEIPVKAMELYVKTRLHIKIKTANKKIIEERRERAQRRADSIAQSRVDKERRQSLEMDDDEEEEEDYGDDDMLEEDEDYEEEDDQMEEGNNDQGPPLILEDLEYQRYLRDAFDSEEEDA
jgi:hypothetical protein